MWQNHNVNVNAPEPAIDRTADLPAPKAEPVALKSDEQSLSSGNKMSPVQSPLVLSDSVSPVSPKVKKLVGRILRINSTDAPHLAYAYAEMERAWRSRISIRMAPSGNTGRGCNPGEAAYTLDGDPDIYICALILNEGSDNATAQALIHETAHIIGFANECDATSLAMSALRTAGIEPYRNGYADSCGL